MTVLTGARIHGRRVALAAMLPLVGTLSCRNNKEESRTLVTYTFGAPTVIDSLSPGSRYVTVRQSRLDDGRDAYWIASTNPVRVAIRPVAGDSGVERRGVLGPIAHAAPCARGGGVLIDEAPRRIYRIAADGEPRYINQIPAEVGQVHLVQCEHPGDLVLVADPVPLQVRSPSLLRTNTMLLRLRADSAGLDTIIALGGRELFLIPGTPPREAPFGGRLVAVAGNLMIHLGTTDNPVISQVQFNGRLLGSTSFITETDSIPRSQVDSALRQVLGSAAQGITAETYQQMLDSLATNRRRAAWSMLAVGPDGELWIASAELHDDGQRVWQIFRRDGYRIARAVLPGDVTLMLVGTDIALGVQRGPRERVVRFPLRRGASIDSATALDR